jgi:proline iminopeptidase
MRIEAGGIRVWFDVDGPALVPDGRQMRERPTVVLLHGGPGSFDHSYFKPDFARLAASAQVVYLDLAGHGRSDWGDPNEWTFEGAADTVRDFCDAVDIARPIVLGHSLGGFVALVYAIRHPEHPGGLVLQSTFARYDLGRIVEHFRRVGGDDIAAIAERAYGGAGDVAPEEWEPCWKLFGLWVPGDDERARTVAHRELNAPGLERMRDFDAVGDLRRIECPTLVCVGDLDPIAPVPAAREIADAMQPGRARLEIIEGAGHFTWRDAPDRFWPLLTEFVAASAAARLEE